MSEHNAFHAWWSWQGAKADRFGSLEQKHQFNSVLKGFTTRPPLEHCRADLSWSKVKKQIQVTERHFFEHLFWQVRRVSGHSRELQLRRRASFISGRGRQKLRHAVILVSLNVRVIPHHNSSLSFSAVILWAANCHVLSEPNNAFIMQLLNCWVALFIKFTISCVWWMSFTGFGYRTV